MDIVNVKLLTSCIDHLRSFYSHTLELPLQSDLKDEFTVKVGESTLTFVSNDRSGHVEEKPFYHFAFDIPSTKIDESVQWLESNGVAVNLIRDSEYKIYSSRWNATSIYFYDPAGNIVEFIAKHNLDDSSNSRASFSSKDIIHISEIGLVVNDVPTVMDLLKTELNLDGYKDYNDTFAPIGDETGMFILSANNRVWLGSDKKANIFKTEVTVKGTPKRSFSINEYPYYIKST